MGFNVQKDQGNFQNGVLNMSLGKSNPTPSATAPPGKSLKGQGTTSLSTRLPVTTARGEVGPHKGI